MRNDPSGIVFEKFTSWNPPKWQTNFHMCLSRKVTHKALTKPPASCSRGKASSNCGEEPKETSLLYGWSHLNLQSKILAMTLLPTKFPLWLKSDSSHRCIHSNVKPEKVRSPNRQSEHSKDASILNATVKCPIHRDWSFSQPLLEIWEC